MKKTAIFLLASLSIAALAPAQKASAQEPPQTALTSAQPVSAPAPRHTTRPAKKASRWSLDILAGPAFPVGQYANGRGIPGFGPIHSGGVAEISGKYNLCRSFGILLLAGGQLNKGNGIPFSAPVPTPQNSSATVNPTYNSEYWKIARFMTGGEYALPINKQRLSLLFRLLGGVQKTKPADYNFYFPNSDNRLSYPSVNLPWSFSYQIDAGLQWQADKRVAMIAYTGYNGSRSSKDFSYVLETFTAPAETITEKETFPTGSLLFRAGITYLLP